MPGADLADEAQFGEIRPLPSTPALGRSQVGSQHKSTLVPRILGLLWNMSCQIGGPLNNGLNLLAYK